MICYLHLLALERTKSYFCLQAWLPGGAQTPTGDQHAARNIEQDPDAVTTPGVGEGPDVHTYRREVSHVNAATPLCLHVGSMVTKLMATLIQ